MADSKSPKLEWSIEDRYDTEGARYVYDSLRRFNFPFIGHDQFKPLAVLLQDESKKIYAGLLGQTYWTWLYVDVLWVDEAYRHQGLGAQLLKVAEEEARRRGCHGAQLDTMSFQALPFYQKQGYSLFGQLDDFAAGHCRYFLKKIFN